MNPTGKGGFQKGISGNPGGRATRYREDRYREITLNTITFDDWRRIVLKARDQALKGDAVARKWLADYLIGLPIQKQEITGADGNGLKIIVEYADSALIPTSAP